MHVDEPVERMIIFGASLLSNSSPAECPHLSLNTLVIIVDDLRPALGCTAVRSPTRRTWTSWHRPGSSSSWPIAIKLFVRHLGIT